MNRIFISYRSSDGKKDAARLAADLNERFGEELVFYDKQDLVGGSSWRDAINATLGSQPVVLVLITPDLLGAMHPEGGRRIDREDDPIRNELLTARHNGAVILPLLTEGTPMPASHLWPPPLRFVGENHARPLRTDDWITDLQRIEDDLRAHRIPAPAAATSGSAPAPTAPPAIQPLVTSTAQAVVRRVQRGLMIIGGIMVALVVIGLLLPDDNATPPSSDADAPPLYATAPPPQPAAKAAAGAPLKGFPADASGVWWSVDDAGHRTRVEIKLQGSSAALQTDAIPVAWDPEWQTYAQRLAAQGTVFDHIRYSGSGGWANGRLQMRVEVHSAEGDGPLDTGSLTLAPSTDGRELNGQLWSNGEQASTPLRLVRQP